MIVRNSFPVLLIFPLFLSACGPQKENGEGSPTDPSEQGSSYKDALEDISLLPDDDAPPLVCRMDSVEKFQRAQRLKEDLYARLLAIEELDGGYALKFPADEEMMLLIHEHVRTEWQCCPFFRFELHYPSGHAPLWVHFKGGTKVKEMLRPKMEEMRDALKEKGRSRMGTSVPS